MCLYVYCIIYTLYTLIDLCIVCRFLFILSRLYYFSCVKSRAGLSVVPTVLAVNSKRYRDYYTKIILFENYTYTKYNITYLNFRYEHNVTCDYMAVI